MQRGKTSSCQRTRQTWSVIWRRHWISRSSSVFKSFENRDKIRPVGVTSKNSDIGHRRMFERRTLCSLIAALIPASQASSVAKKIDTTTERNSINLMALLPKWKLNQHIFGHENVAAATASGSEDGINHTTRTPSTYIAKHPPPDYTK